MDRVGDRPSGTVTFLFTDIVGSSERWERAPEAMRAAVAEHDRVVGAALDAHGGTVFATGGDGFAVAFAQASEAVAAALDAQRALAAVAWPEGADVEVRMGLHTGEADERGGDYFGPAVNRAARLMGAAHGGQVVVSATTAGLLAGTAGDLRLVDLGPQQLKGVPEPMGAFGVAAADWPWRDVALTTAPAAPVHLPRPADALVGRAHEVASVVERFAGARLVTLTGPGGVGKTRLAVEAAWELSAERPDGAWFVDLAPLADGGAVPVAVAAALGLRVDDTGAATDAILDALAGRQALLVLDNCEHVAAACTTLAAQLLSGGDRVAVLATSRSPLRVAGEQVVVVEPLDPAGAGVELFARRAAEAGAGDLLADDEARGQIAAISRHLDGIPLAIELAAARARSLTLLDLLDRLEDRFHLLRTGASGATRVPTGTGVEHHRTLRATIDWSYDLLDPAAQILFARLAVFGGSFDLAAAESVCGDGDQVDPLDVVDLLDLLVERSMLVADTSGTRTRTRYRLLATLQQYAAERLAEMAHADAVRHRHARHYTDLLNAADRAYQCDGYLRAPIERFDHEWDNARVAHAWWTGAREDAADLELLLATQCYAVQSCRYEHQRWVQEVEALGDLAPPDDALARALEVSWAYHHDQQEDAALMARIEEATARTAPDGSRADLLVWTAHAQLGWRHDPAALRLDELERVLTAAADSPFLVERAEGHFYVQLATIFSDRERADRHQAAIDRLAAASANPLVRAYAIYAALSAGLAAGHAPDFLAGFRSAIELAREGGSLVLDYSMRTLAVLALIFQGDEDTLHAVRDTLAEVAGVSAEYQSFQGSLRYLLDGLATHWARTGDEEAASVVFGYLIDRDGLAPDPVMSPVRNRALERLHATDVWSAASAAGAAMTRDEVVAYALDHLPAAGA